HILENGKANWDITKSDESKTDEDTTDSNFRLKLKQLEIKNIKIVYWDEQAKMKVATDKLDVDLSGDFTADETVIKTILSASNAGFEMDDIPYLSKAEITGDIRLDADLKNSKFTLKENTLTLNALKIGVDGWLALLDDGSTDMDIKLNAPSTQFKDILSLIPAIYAKDFASIKTSGTVSLAAAAKGLMKGDTVPSFNVKLAVADATFQYPDLPKSITNISIDALITNPGGSSDLTVIDVPKFHLNMGGNPFALNLHASHLFSDLDFALGVVGKIDLNMIKDIYPLENDMQLNGILNTNLKVASRMSTIEKEQYENVKAEGTLSIANMLVKSKETSDIQINDATLNFTPRAIDLSSLNVKIGENDIAASGKLENFIAYALKDQTLKGSLNVKSNYLNLNDFMSESDAQTETESSTAVFEIPKNISFMLNGNFQKVLFDNLTLENVQGQIIVNGGKVDMKNLEMNALGGSMNVNGSYDTSVNPQKPTVNVALNVKQVAFAEAFKTFETVKKIAPIFETLGGRFSTTFNMNTALGSDFTPDFTTLTASGLLQSSEVNVQNLSVMDALAGALKNDKLKSFNVKDLNLPFTVADGRVNTKPFDVKMGGLGNMNLSGTMGLDQTVDYVAKVDLPDSKISSYVKNLSVKIKGTLTSPKIELDYGSVASQVVDNALSAVTGGAVENVADVVNKAVEEAQKQADKLVAEAKTVGDKLVAEAQKQADELVAKTSNPLAKVAAEKAGKALVDEARKKADNLNAEAKNQAQKLIDDTKAKTQK
ncbi:MAG: AsmA family protein, partial [Bacteroidales bacterium]|nr:AsmA family protein [Bacteroidales bacterium]